MTTLHPFAIGTLSAAVLALSLSGCGKQQDAHAASPQAPQAAPVSVAEVKPVPVPVTLTVMVAVPGATPVTLPVASTVAIVAAEEA